MFVYLVLVCVAVWVVCCGLLWRRFTVFRATWLAVDEFDCGALACFFGLPVMVLT